MAVITSDMVKRYLVKQFEPGKLYQVSGPRAAHVQSACPWHTITPDVNGNYDLGIHGVTFQLSTIMTGTWVMAVERPANSSPKLVYFLHRECICYTNPWVFEHFLISQDILPVYWWEESEKLDDRGSVDYRK